MKKILIIAVVILFLVLLAAGTILLLRGKEDTWLCKNGIWEKHGNPSSPMPKEPCLGGNNSGQIKENSEKKLIGGDRDEHGCLTPAGYSWCETKQKCLRTWEEICPPN